MNTPEGIATRPTLDRAKETIFNIINFNLDGATCLDLFAGSGQIGIEMLSRGAEQCVFVDYSAKVVEVIRSNLSALNITAAVVYQQNALEALKMLQNKMFDVIYLDPPFGEGIYLHVLEKIMSYELLAEEGIIVCESSYLEPISIVGNLKIIKEKKVGTVKFTLLGRQ
ncbi:MAG: 16S rRNA (guanine(966)-N(2))-methyltransferase RsmD [Corallococcus sp.]|nr:16S rRNA (guanine(966)-N(2))-methyltransferase RsmD [Corallococcus sp.]